MLNIAVTNLARRAVDVHFSATGKKSIVAGSLGLTGEMFEPPCKLNHESALTGFREQVDAPAESRVDDVWIETMP